MADGEQDPRVPRARDDIGKEVTTNLGLQQQADSGSGGLASGNVGEASQGTAERQAFITRRQLERDEA